MAESKTPSAYEQGYALQPANAQWGIEKTAEWARGVQARHWDETPKSKEKYLDKMTLKNLLGQHFDSFK